jgi:DNA-binding response OmpR family regulator
MEFKVRDEDCILSDTSKRTILVVDDEAGQRNLMRNSLQTEGYGVLESSDYAEALAVHGRHRGAIDLLVVDLSLPGGNGYELSKAILSVEPNLKVLFISGHAGAALCKFLGLNVTDQNFLQKPLVIPDFLNRVRLLLETAGHSSGLRRRSSGK